MSSHVNKADIAEAVKTLAVDRSSEIGWSTLHRLLWPFVVGTIARALGGAREGLDDISQDVFYRLVKSCDFNAFPNEDAFLGYLHAICTNVARDSLRKRSISQVSGNSNIDNLPSPNEHHRLSDERLRLRKIFAELDSVELRLAEFLLQGYTLKEIAHLTDQTYGGLAVRIHRLRAKLRNLG